MLLLFFLTLTVSTQSVDQPADGPAPVPKIDISRILERFSGGGDATPFSLGFYKDAEFLVAVADDTHTTHVAIGQTGGGRIHTVETPFEKRPALLLDDLDGDGNCELFVCSERVQAFQILQDELRLMWTSDDVFELHESAQMMLADLDQDGDKDLAVLNYKDKDNAAPTKSLYLYRNDGGDTPFISEANSVTLTDELGFHSNGAMAIADFYSDSQLEIIVGNDNGSLWLIDVQNVAPVVNKTWKVPSGGAIGPALASGNLAGDERKELLVGTNGGDIFVFQITEDAEPKCLATKHTGRMAYGVGAMDVDGDGEEEFIHTRGYQGYAEMTQHDVVMEIYKLDHNIIDRYSLERLWIRNAEGFVAPRLRVQDVNNDGRKDMVVFTAFGSGRRVEFVVPTVKPQPK
jgi:hypothetical protein